MKKETYAAKLFELLGMTEKVEQEAPELVGKKPNNTNSLTSITEDEIRNFRAIQGVTYFLQAPELFTARVCPHCGETFLVSRQFVAFCSYTCIEKDTEARYGVKWRRRDDIELMIKEVYDGNEPLWISPNMVKRLQAVLDSPKEYLLSPTDSSPQESPSLSETDKLSTSSLTPTTI